ncbi:hypothetical protein BDB00DRAFT_784907 [Zychaea mexicana]|uniref:uncharacterized protein n=1 Tax=Zychaea mexicana TaxID=64656 RepID=UPI0022FE45F7|nr:uncharacterized protein BDB00DRAFT_784907 [Zychaea mexicana]KAI9497165.1 hypothetical protein BDB00DRAFT_784907 [Zychaea mexicana]
MVSQVVDGGATFSAIDYCKENQVLLAHGHIGLADSEMKSKRIAITRPLGVWFKDKTSQLIKLRTGNSLKAKYTICYIATVDACTEYGFDKDIYSALMAECNTHYSIKEHSHEIQECFIGFLKRNNDKSKCYISPTYWSSVRSHCTTPFVLHSSITRTQGEGDSD